MQNTQIATIREWYMNIAMNLKLLFSVYIATPIPEYSTGYFYNLSSKSCENKFNNRIDAYNAPVIFILFTINVYAPRMELLHLKF